MSKTPKITPSVPNAGGALAVRGGPRRSFGGQHPKKSARRGSAGSPRGVPMNVLVIDIGGTNVKVLASGQSEPRKFPSGPKMTPQQMVSGVKELAAEWKYD